MRIGLALKLNLIVLAAVLALGATLGAFFVTEQRTMLDRELDRRIHIAGPSLALDVGDALAENDAGTLDRILVAAVRNREIAYVIVKSTGGEILAARWAAQTRGDVTEYTFPLHSVPRPGTAKAMDHFGAVPLKAEGDVIGHLAVGVDLSGKRATLHGLIGRTVLTVGLGAILATLLGTIFVSLFLRRSITPLLTGIRGVGAGDLSQRVPPGRDDEIGEIGGAFNDMADRLSATLVSKQELETTVSRRTAQLEEALEERIRAQAVLAEREESIRLLLHSTAEAIYGIDAAGVCTFCNPACVRMLGYRRAEEIVGKNMHGLIHHTKPDGTVYPEKECPVVGVSRDGNGYHAENEVLWKADGSMLHAECWSYPILRGTTLTGAVVTFLDLTERRHLERQLAQAQKLEGIGILAGGIAHDFNNLLTPILGYTEMALLGLPDGHPVARKLKVVLESARRASDITRQILAFSRKQVLDMRVVDLNETVAGVVKMLRRLIGEDIEVRLDLGAGLPCVKADPSQMQQVLVNLAVNARDAMPGGGTLTIRTSATKDDNCAGASGGNPARGCYAVLSVSDTGIGMDDKTRQRIFEPFFTTKEVGKGTGLGLSTVHGIVRQHGGDITVSSAPGRGTTFRVYLPCSDGAPRAESAPPPLPARGSGRILLVEDDDAVRELAGIMLADNGYTVTSVPGGAEALEHATRTPFDLLVSDVVMPGMNGVELYRKIAEIAPGLKVLFVSGYPTGSGSLPNILAGGERFLHKPFTTAELLEKVRQAIEPAG